MLWLAKEKVFSFWCNATGYLPQQTFILNEGELSLTSSHLLFSLFLVKCFIYIISIVTAWICAIKKQYLVGNSVSKIVPHILPSTPHDPKHSRLSWSWIKIKTWQCIHEALNNVTSGCTAHHPHGWSSASPTLLIKSSIDFLCQWSRGPCNCTSTLYMISWTLNCKV